MWGSVQSWSVKPSAVLRTFCLQARAVETAARREEAAGGGAALSTEGPQGEGRGRGQQVQPWGLLGGDGHHL